MSRDKAFVIMPFTLKENDVHKYHGDQSHWTEVYEGLIAPALISAGLEPERDDEDFASRLIVEGIWRKLEEASLVLCDLSSFNPNVYLELGWALRADKRFVLIKDDLTAPSFDLNQFFTYTYSHRLQPSHLRTAVPQLQRVITETMQDSRKQYSLVRKLSLQMASIQASAGGTVEVDLLQELLSEVRGSKKLEPAGKSMVRPKKLPRIKLYWHQEEFTKTDATLLADKINSIGAESIITRHIDLDAPDAIWIGKSAHPELIRTILTNLSYTPRFIFPSNYPDAECGAQSEFEASVGLSSKTRDGVRPKSEDPFSISEDQWLSLINPEISNYELRRQLNAVAG